jgi:hypothetical protein
MPIFTIPTLTTARIRTAYAVAFLADALQMGLAVVFPLSLMPGIDNVVDLVVMFILSRLLGFHFLLLPTFLLELFPSTVLPTWTACTVAVVQIRKREQHFTGADPAPPQPPQFPAEPGGR